MHVCDPAPRFGPESQTWGKEDIATTIKKMLFIQPHGRDGKKTAPAGENLWELHYQDKEAGQKV